MTSKKVSMFVRRLAAELPTAERRRRESRSLFVSLVASMDEGKVKNTIHRDVDSYFALFADALSELEMIQEGQQDDDKTTGDAAADDDDAVQAFPLQRTRALFGVVGGESSTTLLRSLRCGEGRMDVVAVAKALMATAPSVSSELADTVLMQLVMLEGGGGADTPSVGCVWAYSAVHGTRPTSLLPAFLLLSHRSPELWAYALGFVAFWASRVGTGLHGGDHLEDVVAGVLSMASADSDVDPATAALCVSALASWARALTDSPTKTGLLDIAADELLRTSPGAQGKAQPFWAAVLYPALATSGALGAADLRRYKEVPSGVKSIPALMEWLREEPQEPLSHALGTAVGHLLHTSGLGAVEEDEEQDDDDDNDNDDDDYDDDDDDGEGEASSSSKRQKRRDEEDNIPAFFIDTAGDDTVFGHIDASTTGDDGPSEMEKELKSAAASSSSGNRTHQKEKQTKKSEPQNGGAGGGKKGGSADSNKKSRSASTDDSNKKSRSASTDDSNEKSRSASTDEGNLGGGKQRKSSGGEGANANGRRDIVDTPGSSARPVRSARENHVDPYRHLGDSFPSSKNQTLTQTASKRPRED